MCLFLFEATKWQWRHHNLAVSEFKNNLMSTINIHLGALASTKKKKKTKYTSATD